MVSDLCEIENTITGDDTSAGDPLGWVLPRYGRSHLPAFSLGVGIVALGRFPQRLRSSRSGWRSTRCCRIPSRSGVTASDAERVLGGRWYPPGRTGSNRRSRSGSTWPLASGPGRRAARSAGRATAGSSGTCATPGWTRGSSSSCSGWTRSRCTAAGRTNGRSDGRASTGRRRTARHRRPISRSLELGGIAFRRGGIEVCCRRIYFNPTANRSHGQ